MAVHLSMGRFPLGFLALSLVVFFGVAGSRATEPPGQPASAPNAANPGVQAASRALTLFESGAEIRFRKDAKVYITSRNIPENDRLLEAYSVDRTDAGEGVAAPGLLGIALQARRSQARRSQARRSQARRSQARRSQDGAVQGGQAYSLADAMRDAIWRKNTAARLRSLTVAIELTSPTAAVGGCAEGSGGSAKRGALWTGLGARC